MHIRSLPFLLLPVLLLSACGGGTLTLPVVRISSVPPLQVGSTTKLSVTVLNSTGTVTYTSSDSSAVSVDAGGTLTVRHLSATGQPVVISANVVDGGAQVDVTTYGLDAAGGTYSATGSGTPAVSPNFFLRFRTADGKAVTSATPVTISGPGGASYSVTLNAGSESTTAHSSGQAAVSGSYTAALSAGGQAYSKTFALDAAQVLAPVSALSVGTSSDGGSAVLGGSLPGGAASATVIVNSPDFTVYNYTDTFSAVPATLPWLAGTLARGSYAVEVDALSARRDSGVSTPDALNVSAYTSPTPLTY